MANNELTSFIPDSAIDEYLATGSAPDEYLPYLQAAMPLQSPEPAKQPEQDSRPSGITGAFGSGVKQTGGLLGSAWDTITNDQEELRRDALAPAEKTAEQEAFEQTMQRNLDASPSNSFWQDAKDVGSAIWDQPMGAFHTMIGQLPNSAVVLGGMWAGAKTGAATGGAIGSAAGGIGAVPGAAVGAIVGGITGMYAGNAAIETGAIAQDAMREGEFDRGEVLQQAATKAGVITGIDTATMGVGKLILGAPSRAATAAVTERLTRAGIDASDNVAVARAFTDTALAREVLDAGEQAYRAAAPGFGRYAAQGALETTAEGTGEYLGSLTAGLEATFADAILESVMSAPQSAVDVAISSSMAGNDIANRQLSRPEQLANAALTARENAAAGGADALGQAQAVADTLSNWTPTSVADELIAGDFPASRREMRGIQREVGTPDLPPIEVAPDGTALVGGMSDQERMFYERSKQQQRDAVGLLARGQGVQPGKTKLPEQPMPQPQAVEMPLTLQQPPIQNQPGVTMTAPKPDLILRANGAPFKTERSAKLSAKFKSNPGATVAPIEGGFAIQLPVQPITNQEVDQQPGVAAPQAAPAVEAPVVESAPSMRTNSPRRTQQSYNPDRDSLKRFIAAAGGLSREAAAEIGLDPAIFNDGRFNRSGTPGGMPFIRKEGGLSLGELFEYASQEGVGYAQDQQEFIDKIFDTVAGKDHFTATGWEYQAELEAAERDRLEQERAAGVSQFEGMVHDMAEQARAAGVDLEIIAGIINRNAANELTAIVELRREAESLQAERLRSEESISDAEGNRAEAEEFDWDSFDFDGTGNADESALFGQDEQPLLNSYTEQDLAERDAAAQASRLDQEAEQQAAENKAKADAEANDFVLSGSNRPADVATSRGQNDLFGASQRTPSDQPANPVSAEADTAPSESEASTTTDINQSAESGSAETDDGVAFSKRQGGSKKSRAALIKKHGANYVNGDIELVDPVIRDAAKAYLGRLSEAESKRINDNLIKFRGTPWGNAAIKGLATREAWHRAENGQDFSDIDNSEIWGKDAGGIARSHFTKAIQKGEQAIIDAMMSYKVLRDNRKAEKHVSTSFKNCDPSLACAKHCYSAGGQGGGPAAVRQAEFMELLAERFPDRFAKKIASQYRASALGEAGLALRINDKGDLSEAQLDVLKRLNDDGIRLQVFSKRPELLRKLDPMNLRMLSVDDTNFQLALDNPDLQLAVTITDGMTEEQVSQVADRVAVYLPVNLKSTAWTHKQIKDKFPGVFDKMKKKLCPVESNKGVITKPGTSFVHIVNKETDNAQGMIWTCTYCDLKGAAGCFNGDNQTKLAMKVRQQNLLASSDVATQEFIRAYNQTKAGLDAMVSMGAMTNAERDEILSRVNRGTGTVRQDAEAGAAREGGTQYSPRNSRDERGGNPAARELGDDAGRGLGGLNAPSGQSQSAGVDQATRRLEAALGRSAGRNLPAGTVTRAVLDAASQGQQWAAEFAQEAARLFQKTAVFVDINDAELDGSFDGAALRGDPNTLYINSSATTPYHVVMGHELTHLLKQDHADLYQQLEDLIIPQATRREDSAKFHGYDVNSAKGREEYVADVVGNRFGEKAFWEAMAQHNPTGFRKIARIARSIIEKLVNTFRHKRTKYGDSVRELNRLRSDIAKVMSQYQSRQNPTAKVSAESEPMFQAAWHGTPHSWEHNKASLDAIGTGEGAQAYGWGLYFAGKREVAEWYRDELSKGIRLDFKASQSRDVSQWASEASNLFPDNKKIQAAFIMLNQFESKEGALSYFDDMARFAKSDPSEYELDMNLGWGDVGTQKVGRADFADIADSFFYQPGNLYQVDIPEDSELLDWDKPLSEQKAITDLIRRDINNVPVPEWVSDQYMVDTVGEYITEGDDVVTGADLYRMLKYLFVENAELQMKVAGAIGMDETSAEFGALPDDQAASLYLDSLGIPGLRYLDGTSRNDREDASHNYVIWDEDLVTVEAVNDELVQAEQQAADEGVDFSRRQRTEEAFNDLTAEQRSALSKIGPKTIPQRIKDRIDKLMDRIGLKLRQGMVHRFASLRELDEQARGKNVVREDTANSSWVLSRMSASADGALNSLMNFGRIKMNDGAIDVDTTAPGLIEVLKRLGDSHEIERFMGWIAGNRADKLFDQERENLFEREEIDGLMTLNQGTLKDGRSREAVYNEVFADFQKARDDVLAIADQAGLLRKGLEDEEALLVMASTHKMGQDIAKKIRRLDRQYMQAEDAEEQLEIGQKQGRLYQGLQELLSENLNDFDGELEVLTTDQRELWADEFYVPFYRIMEEDQSDRGPRNTSGLSRQETYKRLKGGKQDLGDLLENTLLNFHHLLSASLKNKAAQVALDNAEAMNVAEVTTAADRKDNASTFVLRDGMKTWYNISDPLVYEALTSLTDIGMNSAAMRVMRAFKRVFTEFTTASPQFMAANLIRDSFQAVALADMDRNPIANAVKGINAYGMFDKNKELRARMLSSGGAFAFGHQFGEDADAIKSAIDREMRNGKIISSPSDVWQAMRAGWDYYRGLSDSLENANRAAIFKKAAEGGENLLLSAFESRDLMDFSAHGAWPAIRFLTGVVPFLNARIQGLDKIYRSGVKPGYNVMRELFPGGDQASDTDRKAAARFWAVTGALTAATMALYLVNYDDEDYRELEDWQKDAYWAFKAGDSMFFIPKPFEVGAIATLAERGLEQMIDDKATGKLFAERLGHMMMDTFSFDPTPQMLSPLVDIYANKDSFSGRPIESVGMERLSPSQRSRANTTEFAKGLSAFTESTFGEVLGKDSKFVLSPVQIDYLIGGYLGWLGERAIGVTDVMAKTAMGKTDPAKAWYEYQPMRRFYKDLDLPGYSKYQTRFYEDLREVNRVYADIQNYRKLGQVEEALKLAKEKRNLLAQRKALNGIQRQLGTINQRMKLVRNSNKSPEEKRAELDRLQAIKNRMTKLVAEKISRE